MATALVVFLLDQGVKYLVIAVAHLPMRGTIELLPILKFIWVNNPGVSLGLLTATTPAQGWGLVALTAAIAGGVAVWLWRERNRQDAFGLGLILGGALGNIVDRAITGLANPVEPGHVIDFINLHFGAFSPFLVFNIADAAISCGVLILLLRAFVTRDKPKATFNA